MEGAAGPFVSATERSGRDGSAVRGLCWKCFSTIWNCALLFISSQHAFSLDKSALWRYLSVCCKYPSQSSVMVVPGTCTFPVGSSAPVRIECDRAERANPATSALWQRPHPLGSIDSIGLLAAREIRAGACIWVCAVKTAGGDKYDQARQERNHSPYSHRRVDRVRAKSIYRTKKVYRKCQRGTRKHTVLFGRVFRQRKF